MNCDEPSNMRGAELCGLREQLASTHCFLPFIHSPLSPMRSVCLVQLGRPGPDDLGRTALPCASTVSSSSGWCSLSSSKEIRMQIEGDRIHGGRSRHPK